MYSRRSCTVSNSGVWTKMSKTYEGQTKRFSINAQGAEVTKVEGVVAQLQYIATHEENPRLSILESTKNNTVTFTFVRGPRTGQNVVKSDISPEECAAFIAQITGNKKLIRQRASGLHRAFTELNVRECYQKVLEGVAMAKGWSVDQAHSEFVNYVAIEMGEIKVFSADALNELVGMRLGKTKSEAAKETSERVNLLRALQASVVDSGLRRMIENLGYKVDEFISAAKDHHFVHYSRRGDSGEWRLHKGTAFAAFQRMSSSKTEKIKNLVLSEQVRYDRAQPHILINLTVSEASIKTKNDFTITARLAPTRGEDEDLKSAQEFLKGMRIPDATIAVLSGVKIKETAVSMGWRPAAAAAAVAGPQ